MELKKIVVLGPESTGKSTLCEQLARHYDTRWVPEYAREFLITNGTAYTYETLYTIAAGQVNHEDQVAAELMTANSDGPLIIDTDLYVMKVWSEFVFGKCDNRILSQIASRKYDLYLLCDTDLPWTKDELREYPNLEERRILFHFYKDLLVNQHVPWAIIQGTHEERLLAAVKAVDAGIGKM